MPRVLYELFGRGKIAFVLATILGSIFCLTLGFLSVGIFAIAVRHIYLAVDISQNKSLIHIFDAVGLVALSVAVLDLATTIFREVILRDVSKRHPSQVRKSLTRFGTIIIIAILIEGFIMIFRFSKAGQTHLIPYAILVLGGATMLIIGLGLYLKMTVPIEGLLDTELDEK